MGRGKVQLKRIEDKSSRHVSFSKRQNGLMKKSHELSVLCDVDVAVFVFSSKGRLYEFSTGESMTKILARYQDHQDAEELVHKAVRERLGSEYTDVRSADELTEMIQGHVERHNIEKHDIHGLNQLEQKLHVSLQEVRNRKTQLMMGAVKALQDKEIELNKEKKIMMAQIMAARMNEDGGDDPPPQHQFI